MSINDEEVKDMKQKLGILKAQVVSMENTLAGFVSRENLPTGEKRVCEWLGEELFKHVKKYFSIAAVESSGTSNTGENTGCGFKLKLFNDKNGDYNKVIRRLEKDTIFWIYSCFIEGNNLVIWFVETI